MTSPIFGQVKAALPKYFESKLPLYDKSFNTGWRVGGKVVQVRQLSPVRHNTTAF